MTNLIDDLVNKKSSEDNIICLNAYSKGLQDMLDYIQANGNPDITKLRKLIDTDTDVLFGGKYRCRLLSFQPEKFQIQYNDNEHTDWVIASYITLIP